MNITKPQEMTSGTSKVEEAVSKFEEQFAKDEKDQQYYHTPKVKVFTNEAGEKFAMVPVEVTEWTDGKFVANWDNSKGSILDRDLQSVTQGNSEEEAVNELFSAMSIIYNYHKRNDLKYRRLCPFIKGDWKRVGGTWFTIFGWNFYFRRGKQCRHGFFIPFTTFNIMITNEWKLYRDYVKKYQRKK